MTRCDGSLILAGETTIKTLNYPDVVDHAWLYVAYNIHARMLRVTGNDIACDAIRNIFSDGTNEAWLEIDNRYTWSDYKPLTAQEAAKALERGNHRTGGKIFDTIKALSNSLISVKWKIPPHLRLKYLASHLFTITPCLHDASPATLGPYKLVKFNSQRGLFGFISRPEHPRVSPQSPSSITLRSGLSSECAERLLLADDIHLSAPLGVSPTFWVNNSDLAIESNRKLNFAVYLTKKYDPNLGINSCLPNLIDVIDINSLALTTKGTMEPIYAEATLKQVACKVHPSHHCIFFTPFEPNQRIADNLCEQFSAAFDNSWSTQEISYADYMRDDYPFEHGYTIEIMDTVNTVSKSTHKAPLHIGQPTKEKYELPLLRCRSTFMRSPNRSRITLSVTPDGLLDWCEVRGFR